MFAVNKMIAGGMIDMDHTKKLDDNKLAFIVCTNDDAYMDECSFYISQLMVPEGMNVSLLCVSDAVSMTAGYNEAMRSSDARYKVYLHQDVFILNKNFIYDILNIFRQDENIGAIGVAGTRQIPEDARVWSSLDLGGCYSIGTFTGLGYAAVKPGIEAPYDEFEDAEYLDGMLIATSHDIEWDERIGGFHFYDVSFCINMKNDGYRLLVIHQDEPWIFHDFGPLNLMTYDQSRKEFCNIYTKYRYAVEEDDFKIYEMCSKISSALKERMKRDLMDAIDAILDDVGNGIYFSQELLNIYFFVEIRKLEAMYGTDLLWSNISDPDLYRCLERRYLSLKFLLIRCAFGYESADRPAKTIIDALYSPMAMAVTFLHNIPTEYAYIWEKIGAALEKQELTDSGTWQEILETVRSYELIKLPVI